MTKIIPKEKKEKFRNTSRTDNSIIGDKRIYFWRNTKAQRKTKKLNAWFFGGQSGFNQKKNQNLEEYS